MVLMFCSSEYGRGFVKFVVGGERIDLNPGQTQVTPPHRIHILASHSLSKTGTDERFQCGCPLGKGA